MTLQLDTAIKTKRIIKSLGFSEKFDLGKLEHAINTALDFKNPELKTAIMKEVIDKVRDKGTVSTSYINDIIESYLMKKNKIDILQKYMTVRLEKNKELADKYGYLGDRLTSSPHFRKQELKDFSVNQIKIAAGRYLLKDMETGETTESMSDWFHRVARHVVLGSVVYDAAVYTKEEIGSHRKRESVADQLLIMSQTQEVILDRFYSEHPMNMIYDRESFKIVIDRLLNSEKYQDLEKKYFNYMYKGIFEPNTPTLMNAGTENGKCSACFSLDVFDTMISIGNIWPSAALIYQGAGGLGVNVSYIRPAGANVGSTFGASTGPIPLVLEMIDKITDVVKSGGKRRGANMGIMEYWHPDITKFINMKKKPGYLENFNVSVMFDNQFWNHYYDNTDYPLQFNNKVYNMMSAKSLFEDIAVSAWNSAEPGVLFKDNANLANPLAKIREEIHITNPCFHPDTLIETVQGQVKIRDIKEPIRVYTERNGKLSTSMASASWKTRENAKTLKLNMNNGRSLIVTPEHRILVEDIDKEGNKFTQWLEAQDLKIGDHLVSLNRARRGACYSGVRLSIEGYRNYKMEHRFIYKECYGDIPEDYDIHHIDCDTYNNSLDNLELLSHNEHAKLTALSQPNDHYVFNEHGRFTTHDESRKGKKTIIPMPEHLRSNHKPPHPRLISIEEGPITDVYDIEVEDTHNVIANGIVAHNCVSGKTRLNTEFGMLTAEELYNYGKPVMVATDNVTAESNMKRRGKSGRRMQLEFKEASKIFKTSDNGIVYRLLTADGYELECTDYHPIVMKDGSRKELRDVKIGEQVAIQSNTGYFGNQGTAAIGALLGFAQNQFEMLEDRMYTSPDLDICLYEIIDEFQKKYGDMLYYDTAKKELLFPPDYDAKEALLSFIKDRVPDIIWRGTKECIQAYIRMIFDTDPNCKLEFNRLEYHNRNGDFLHDLQLLLLNFGVKTTVTAGKELTDPMRLIIPDTSFAHYIFSRIGFRSSSKISKILYNTKNAGQVEYYSTVIGKVKLKDPQPVYDATEFHSHTLIFNGFVTGNCSEQYLYDGESCTLGSINLVKLVKNNKFDWNRYTEIIHDTTRFLNDVLEINVYPTEHIKTESDKTRRIGLGIMGLADLLYILKIPYNSKEAYDFMTELSKTLYIESVKASIDLAEERGSCYWYDELVKKGFDQLDSVKRVYGTAEEIRSELGDEYVGKLMCWGIRNMWTTTIAPTGTISMIANCSNGLEPNYALAFKKTVLAGDFFFANEIFRKALINEGIYSQELLAKVEQNYGSCQGIEEIPEHIQKVFVTAFDTHWLDHIVAQAVWQRWIDNSISKTINMPHNATVDDVKYAYVISHDLGLKGISLYRDGSRETQVLHTDTKVLSGDGATNGVKTTLSNITDKRVFPTEFALNYMSQFLKNKDLAAEIKERVMQGQQFYQAVNNEICVKCKEGKMILEGGCNKCTSCGYSDICSIG